MILGGLILWIFLVCAMPFVAREQGRSGLAWFLVAVFLSPFVAWLLLVALPPRRPSWRDIPIPEDWRANGWTWDREMAVRQEVERRLAERNTTVAHQPPSV